MARLSTPAPLADVIRALVRCGATAGPEQVEKILHAMGWPARTPDAEAALRPFDARPDGRPRNHVEGDKTKRLREPRYLQPSEPVPSTLRPLAPPAMPETAEVRPEFGPLPLPEPGQHRPVFDLPIAPLIEPHLARAVLGRLSAVRLARGELDIDALVATIARGVPALRLPRKPVSTLGPGLQLLIDVAPAMLPFHEDTLALIPALSRTVGADRLDVRRFEACPFDGVIDEASLEIVPYTPPRPGTPVLAVTDLGLVRGDRFERAEHARHWLELSRRLSAQRTPLSVLTPYSRERIGESKLTHLLRIVLWDRVTGVRQVPPAPLVRGIDE